MSPYGWAMAVDAAFVEHQADAVVAETNYGGDMVTANLRQAGVPKRVIGVHCRRGKAIRAEPIVAVYEQHRAHHVGTFAELEEELTTWQPYEDRDSPNRLDALVHGATELLGRSQAGTIASPSQLRNTAARPPGHASRSAGDLRPGRDAQRARLPPDHRRPAAVLVHLPVRMARVGLQPRRPRARRSTRPR